MAVTWRLPHHASIVGDGECLSRACVAGGGVLTVKYLHPEDAGRYTCMAENAYGKDQRDVTLEVTVREKVARRPFQNNFYPLDEEKKK